jgi:hypothetical protein
MLLYLVGLIILLVILFNIYIRLKNRFWSIQPVFHYYDLYYWIYNKGIINDELPKKNKYIHYKNIQTFEIDKLTNNEISNFILLVQQHYFINRENKFYPKKENILNYFKGHNHSCFISTYNKENLLHDIKNNSIIEDKQLIGVITSRPLNVRLIQNKKINKFEVYYVDYLCVNKFYRKQNIAPQLIQTHEYNQRHNNKNIVVSLFKREEELTSIIPLTIYKTYCYNMKLWNKPLDLNPNIKLLTCDAENIYYLYNFLNENVKKWDIIINPEMSNILELIKSNNIFIKMLVNNNEIVAFYIFKKTCTFIESNKELLSCIGSMNGYKLTNEEFIQGFKVSLWSIIEEYKTFEYLSVENISDNYKIINNMNKFLNPLVVSSYAYYFYNFAYQPFEPSKVLIIN